MQKKSTMRAFGPRDDRNDYMGAIAPGVLGLTTWETAPDGKIVKTDVSIAMNYLSEKEMSYLERIVSLYLDYAELQAERKIPMSMLEPSVRRLGEKIERFSGI